jgi:AraC-like DNA-binding protein
METINIELHGKSLLIYESKHQEEYVFLPHQHKIHQILFAIDGIGELMLEGKWYPFSQDNAVLILPNSIHAVQSKKSLTLFVLAFHLEEDQQILPTSFFHTYFPISKMIHTEKDASNTLRHIFRKLLFLQAKQHPLHDLEARIQLYEILIVLAKANDYRLYIKFPSMAHRIKQYIDQHYYEIRFANDIASLHHMSVRYMDNLFKEQYGKTPIQYVTEVRIARAQTLLLETNHEIISICFEVGFENVSTFYRSFKYNTGKTPSQYRNLKGM